MPSMRNTEDKGQNDQSGFCKVSSPSPREEGARRGEALQTLPENDLNRFKAPLSLALSPLRRERVFVASPRGFSVDDEKQID